MPIKICIFRTDVPPAVGFAMGMIIDFRILRGAFPRKKDHEHGLTLAHHVEDTSYHACSSLT